MAEKKLAKKGAEVKLLTRVGRRLERDEKPTALGKHEKELLKHHAAELKFKERKAKYVGEKKAFSSRTPGRPWSKLKPFKDYSLKTLAKEKKSIEEIIKHGQKPFKKTLKKGLRLLGPVAGMLSIPAIGKGSERTPRMENRAAALREYERDKVRKKVRRK